jgi:hypothetical protein
MDIGKSFTFVFEDKDWVTKLLIAAAIFLLGILFSWLLLIPLILAAALLLGYSVEITRRVIHRHPQLLPEWDNWGALIADGFKVIVICIVYALPIIVASACIGIPIGIFSNNGGDAANALGGIFGSLLGLFNFVWGIGMSLFLPAAIGIYADTGELRAAFRFRDVWDLLRHNFVTYLITFLMSWVASVVGSLGAIVCGVGWLATLPYSYMVTGHLYGQAYLSARGQAAQATIEPAA